MVPDGGHSAWDDIVESIASGIQSGRGLSDPGVLPANDDVNPLRIADEILRYVRDHALLMAWRLAEMPEATPPAFVRPTALRPLAKDSWSRGRDREMPLRVEYSLSKKGKALAESIAANASRGQVSRATMRA